MATSQPARYGPLHHPGDPFSFDMLSQIGRALRHPEHHFARSGTYDRSASSPSGSRSPPSLTTYVNAVQPVALVFDGFLVHSRGAGARPL